MLQQPVTLTGTIIGNSIPYKNLKTNESSYVYRLLLDEPFPYENRNIIEIYLHIEMERDLASGSHIEIVGTVFEQHVVTRSGKVGRQGILHMKPEYIANINDQAI